MKRIYNLKREKNKQKNEKKTICITGVASHLGTTHLSLSIANYICSILKEHVVYIELSQESCLLSTVGDYPISIDKIDGYNYLGVNYLLIPEIEEAINVIANGTNWIVIDMKELNDKTRVIFNQCKIKIVIGSMMPWCRREYHEFMRCNIVNKINIQDIKFYDKNPTKDGLKCFHKLYGVPINSLPVIMNPFSLEEEHFKALNEIIK